MLKAGKLGLETDRGGEHHFHPRPGAVIALSSEGYSFRARAKNGIESIKKNPAYSPVVEIE
jgi:uncharacterized protein YegP (UPF0339 family)